jgi:hypothetical protein
LQGFLFFLFFLLSTSKLFVVVVRKAVSEESAEERNGVSLLHMTVYNIASGNAHGKTVKFVLEGFLRVSLNSAFLFFAFCCFLARSGGGLGRKGMVLSWMKKLPGEWRE